MPENFYERALELERQIHTLKQDCTEGILKNFTSIYTEAIGYYGFMENYTKCTELLSRMQGVLVKPYVLDCLS